MFERAVNIFWVLLGAAAASYAWTLGIIGSSGPDSGLFPFVSALMIMGSGFVLLLQPRDAALAPDFPRGAALGRVLGVSGVPPREYIQRLPGITPWRALLSVAFTH